MRLKTVDGKIKIYRVTTKKSMLSSNNLLKLNQLISTYIWKINTAVSKHPLKQNTTDY